MGFCVPTNVIPNWMLCAGGAGGAGGVGEGSIFGSLTVKVDTIFFFFFHFCRSCTRKLARAARWMLLFNVRLRMSSAAAAYLFICFNICLASATLQHGASIIYSTGASKVFYLSIAHRLQSPSLVCPSAFPSTIEGNESLLVREAICSHLLLPGSAKHLTFPRTPTVKKGLMRPTVNSGLLALEVTRVSPV